MPLEVLKGVIKLMNKHGMLKATSVAIALCTVMSSTTFAFSTVASAATVDTTEKVSASTTKSKDNFSWDNASVYFLLTRAVRFFLTLMTELPSTAATLPVLHSLSKMVISITSV